jgi:Ca-activated chloride channel homolog
MMIIRHAWTVVMALVCLAATAVLAQQAKPPVLSIVFPPDESYVSGVVTLHAIVAPLDRVVSVTFMVDGRQVCAVLQPPFQCEWDAGPEVKEHQIRVWATLKGGGRVVTSTRTRDTGFAENVDVDVVQVTATVTRGGRFVRDLPISAFKVFEDDRPQTITHFTFEDRPPELVVAIDISSSLSTAMPKVKAAVTELLTAIPANIRVTLLGFNDTPFTLATNETDPAVRAKAVARLAPWGATALYDVIIRAVDMLGRKSGRKAVLIFSDGEDTASRSTLDDVERRLQESDAVVYSIGQGRGVSMERLKKVLQQVSKPTGGRALFTDRIDELKDAFKEILDELSNQYLLGYPPSNAARDGSWRRIKVEVAGGYDIRARHGYRAVAR